MSSMNTFAVSAGTAFCVAAGAVASAGSAGLDYMGINSDALPFVAGCALFSGALLIIGVCMITWGISSQIRRLNESLSQTQGRISELENSISREREVTNLVRYHEDNLARRDIEDKMKDLFGSIEQIQKQDRRQIEIHDAEIRRLVEARLASSPAVSRRLGGDPV